MSNIGIVIVSHSALVAEGTAIMASKMAGNTVPVAWCGGDMHGDLGSNAEMIYEAIRAAWSNSGVAVFVDLGSTEMNSQIAIEKFSKQKQEKIALMNAPLVEGVIIASSRAASGDTLEDIMEVCESFQ